MTRTKYIPLVLNCVATALLSAASIRVSSVSSLQTAIASALPGDTIIVETGIYTTTGAINVACVGSADRPIVICAETNGGVEIGGTAGFSLNSPAAWVVLRGFVFTHSTGTTKVNVGATHCVFAENVFQCAAAGTGNRPYLTVSGDDNEIRYNTFQHKSTEGPMISVQGPGSSGMAQRTWIHHNYFYDFKPTSNNCSAIQIGLSGRSMSAAYSLVEHNLFVETAGENEGGVCNKSCNNVYRYNTFGSGCEELSLRHGNFCEVYGNYFLGSTGVRFSGDDHKIFSNYFQGCASAIVCTNGDGVVPPEGTSALTCHDRPDRVQIVFNTLVSCPATYQEPSRTNGLGAIGIVFANNLISGGGPVSIRGPYANPTWAGNILWSLGAGSIPAGGYTSADPKLNPDAQGISHLQSGSPAIGAAVGEYAFASPDIDGTTRTPAHDVGADEFTSDVPVNRPLTPADVGASATVTDVHARGTSSAGSPPAKFRVYEAYPNPFNPSTRLRYDVPTESHVRMIVYDISGRSLDTLVDRTQGAGTYEYVWDATGYPGGMYFVRLSAGTHAGTIKCVLLK